VFYEYYINTISQVAVAREFLPIEADDIKKYLEDIAGEDISQEESEKLFSYDVEPSVESLVEEVIPIILSMMLYDVILEAKASEHSARMIAMKNAKDNAGKIAFDLTLKYNKARQAMITKEVSEITSGVEALKDV
jgi:F-type H+-transporting ATPase subunit gamma